MYIYNCDACGKQINDTCGQRFEMKISTPCGLWDDERHPWKFDLCLLCIWNRLRDLKTENIECCEGQEYPENMFSWMIDPHRS